jgi:hypothetical protein
VIVAAIVALAIGLRLAGYLYWPVYLVLLAVALAITFVTGRWLQFHFTAHPRLCNTLQGLWLSAATFAALFFVLEVVFRVFVARTDGLAITLSHLNWMKRYWQPVNSLGYRDDEWAAASLAGRTKVLIVGDSFASGVGIVDYHQRMSGVLGQMLGQKYAVMLAAQPGWDTIVEFHALETYPFPPDIVVLTYYINDIDPAAAEHGLKIDNPVPLATSPLYPLIGTSYLLNFVYFQELRLPFNHASDTFLSYLEAAYQTPAIWEEHRAQLMGFYDWSQSHHARLMLVIFPSLLKPQATSFATHKVADAFSGLPVTVINLTPGLVGEDPALNIVNPVDPHPNERLHRLAALDLCRAIAQLPTLPPVECPQ